MYPNGEILKVAFVKRRPFSLKEDEKMKARQSSVSSQINSVISQMAYGQASSADLSNVFQKGWDSANKNIEEVERGTTVIESTWVQIGDPELSLTLKAIESDPNFDSWLDPDLIEQIKKSFPSE